MNRVLVSLILATALTGAAAQALASEPIPGRWVATYRFVAPPSVLAGGAKAGRVAFTLSNAMAEAASDVAVEVEPQARVGFGPFNREQAGNIARRSSAVLHVHLLLAADAKGFPIKVSWKSADGARHVGPAEAFDVAEVQR